MYANSILAVAGLISMAAAVPMAHEPNHHHLHHRRDYVWVTETEEAVVTVPVTQTVWLEPGETAPGAQQENHPAFSSPPQYSHPTASPSAETSSTTSETAAPYVPPTTSSTSQYVAPTTSSSSSTYVAPTSSSSTYVPPPPSPTSSSTSVYTPPPAPTTSSTSVYVAPSPSTSASSTAAASPAGYSAGPSSACSKPAASANAITPSFVGKGATSGLGASGTSYSGDMTYYAVDAGLGACGQQWAATDAVVAISHVIFDSYGTGNPNTNPLCGRTVSIIGSDGQPHKATITDKCPGCAEADLDLSTSLFQEVEPCGDGRVHGVKWSLD